MKTTTAGSIGTKRREPLATRYRLLFRKICGFLVCAQQRPSNCDSLLLRFYIRPQMLSAFVQQDMSGYIKLSQLLEFQVQIEPLTEQIPIEYIGVMHCMSEGRLQYRKYLQIQVEYVEKTNIAFHLIHEQVSPLEV